MAKNINIKSKLTLDSKGFNKGVAKAKKEVKGFGSSIANLIPGMNKFQVSGKAAFAAIVVAAGAATYKMYKYGASIEGIREAFEGLGMEALLKDIRKQVNYTIDDIRIMKSVITFSNFGLPLKDLGMMLDFVRRKALQTGKDFGYLYDSLVEGLSKKSYERLDNLELKIQNIRDAVKLGDTFAAATSKEIKRSYEGVKNLGDGSAAESITQLETALVNLKTAIWDLMKSSGLEKFITGVIKKTSEGVEIFNEAAKNGPQRKLIKDVGKEITSLEKSSKALKKYNNELKQLQGIQKNRESNIVAFMRPHYDKALKELKKALDYQERGITLTVEQKKLLDGNNGILGKDIARLKYIHSLKIKINKEEKKNAELKEKVKASVSEVGNTVFIQVAKDNMSKIQALLDKMDTEGVKAKQLAINRLESEKSSLEGDILTARERKAYLEEDAKFFMQQDKQRSLRDDEKNIVDTYKKLGVTITSNIRLIETINTKIKNLTHSQEILANAPSILKNLESNKMTFNEVKMMYEEFDNLIKDKTLKSVGIIESIYKILSAKVKIHKDALEKYSRDITEMLPSIQDIPSVVPEKEWVTKRERTPEKTDYSKVVSDPFLEKAIINTGEYQEALERLNDFMSSVFMNGIMDLTYALEGLFPEEEQQKWVRALQILVYGIVNVMSTMKQYNQMMLMQEQIKQATAASTVSANASMAASEAATGVTGANMGLGVMLIPGIIATVLAMYSVLKPKKYAFGGIVPGTSFSGDRQLAAVNSGEMILNQAQQANLFKLANSGLSGEVEFKIKGTDLIGVINRNDRKTRLMA